MRPTRVYADVGNSSLHWAVSGPHGWGPTSRVALDPRQTPRDIAGAMRAALEMASCAPEKVAGAALVSSNPRMTDHALAALAGVAPEVVLLGRDLHSDLPIDYDAPDRFGQDRIAALEGARELCGVPVVVLTCGTCLTAQALTQEGLVIVGGIAPGLSIAVAGLAQAVPHLADGARAAGQRIMQGEPIPGPAHSTVESLASGLAAAVCGAAQVMAQAMLDAVGVQAPVLVTGAGADLIARLAGGEWLVKPLLALQGLRVVHERALGER